MKSSNEKSTPKIIPAPSNSRLTEPQSVSTTKSARRSAFPEPSGEKLRGEEPQRVLETQMQANTTSSGQSESKTCRVATSQAVAPRTGTSVDDSRPTSAMQTEQHDLPSEIADTTGQVTAGAATDIVNPPTVPATRDENAAEHNDRAKKYPRRRSNCHQRAPLQDGKTELVLATILAGIILVLKALKLKRDLDHQDRQRGRR